MLKSDELKQDLTNLKGEVRSLLDAKKITEADKKMEEVRNLQANIKIQEELEADEKNNEERKFKEVKTEKKDKNVDEFRAISKYLLQRTDKAPEMTAEERASVNVGNSGAIMPEAFVNQVILQQKGFPSLKAYSHIIPVTTNTGKMPLSKGSSTRKLAKLTSDTEMVKEMITTVPIEFAIDDWGKIIPIENSVLADAGIDFYSSVIAPDFAECALNTENDEILAIVKANKTDVADATDYTSIIHTINQIDPALNPRTVLLTNLNGYDLLDQLKDDNNRPLLSDSLAVEGGKTFKGKEVIALDNDVVTPVTAGKNPFYVVNLFALAKFFDRQSMEIAVSTEAGFTMNQTFIRVLERFDVAKGDDRTDYYIEF